MPLCHIIMYIHWWLSSQWFAWSASKDVHWIVPVFAGIPFGCGCFTIFVRPPLFFSFKIHWQILALRGALPARRIWARIRLLSPRSQRNAPIYLLRCFPALHCTDVWSSRRSLGRKCICVLRIDYDASALAVLQMGPFVEREKSICARFCEEEVRADKWMVIGVGTWYLIAYWTLRMDTHLRAWDTYMNIFGGVKDSVVWRDVS